MTPPTVNAYYDPQMNDINFPAGVLQPPLFDPKMDDAPNYGNTGGTIGHELTHGFDDEGRQFDAKGNLQGLVDARRTREAFEQRAQCIVDQYRAVHGRRRHQDQQQAHARRGRRRPRRHDPGLDGVEGARPRAKKLERRSTGSRPSSASSSASRSGPARTSGPRTSACSAHHRPALARPSSAINGVVVNMPEFESAFACKAGQPMVRQNRCRVW